MANGKAVAISETEGFIKTIFEKDTGELLGAHLIGPEVTELIQGFAIAKKLEATHEELISTIFPHPTLSESMHESVHQVHLIEHYIFNLYNLNEQKHKTSRKRNLKDQFSPKKPDWIKVRFTNNQTF